MEFDPGAIELESEWNAVISDEGLSKSERQQQSVIWEILHFEANYALKLKIIVDVFVRPLRHLANEHLLGSIEYDKIVSNLNDVYVQCCRRWNDVIAPFIRKIRESKKPVNSASLEDLYEFGDLFLEEYQYNLKIEKCKEYINEERERNTAFQKFYTWADSHTNLNKLDVASYLSCPMQHITRHVLLLQRLLECTEDECDKCKLEVTLNRIKSFVSSVNEQIQIYDQQAKLLNITQRIESFELIDTHPEEVYFHLQVALKYDISSPMAVCGEHYRRRLIKEGCLKMKEGVSVKSQEIILFLFTDLVLVAKRSKKAENRVRVIKPPMRLDMVKPIFLKDTMFCLAYINEFGCVNAVYTFTANNSKWYEDITNAKKAYVELWSGRKNFGSMEYPVSDKVSSTELLSQVALEEKAAERLSNNVSMSMELLDTSSSGHVEQTEIRSRAATVSGARNKQLSPRIDQLRHVFASDRLSVSSSSSDLDCIDEETRSKLNQSRLSRDKRYWTASTTHDINQSPKPECAIQKRYSWNGKGEEDKTMPTHISTTNSFFSSASVFTPNSLHTEDYRRKISPKEVLRLLHDSHLEASLVHSFFLSEIPNSAIIAPVNPLSFLYLPCFCQQTSAPSFLAPKHPLNNTYFHALFFFLTHSQFFFTRPNYLP